MNERSSAPRVPTSTWVPGVGVSRTPTQVRGRIAARLRSDSAVAAPGVARGGERGALRVQPAAVDEVDRWRMARRAQVWPEKK